MCDNVITDFTPAGKPWNRHKCENVKVAKIYAGTFRHIKKAERMNACANFLEFGQVFDSETGKSTLHLAKSHFCRVRLCPICQWRRVLLWRSRLYHVLPSLLAQYPKAKFLFLTLTVENCRIEELKATLKDMNQAWHRLIKRKVFSSVIGWIKTIEVTKEKDREGYAHPHFHCLLMVPNSYFCGKNYISQEQWTQAWQEVLKVDYTPRVDIRIVREKKRNNKNKDTGSLPHSAILETLKYSVKFKDITDCPDWFLTFTDEVHHLRFIASGGVFKDLFKKKRKITNDDLIKLDEQSQIETFEDILRFLWNGKYYVFDKAYSTREEEVRYRLRL